MYEFDPEWTDKLDRLREAGINPYPNDMKPTWYAKNIHTAAGKSTAGEIADLVESGKTVLKDVSVGGRLIFKRVMGKAMFIKLQDLTGLIQCYVRREEVGGPEVYNKLKKMDIGDIVFCRGKVFRTKAGEVSVWATECRLAAKTLQPFPDRMKGVTDLETRSRQREVDLFMNDETKDVFQARSRILWVIRQFMDDKEFMEVETPMLQPIPGGANAKPFVTHHNALDVDLFMRIAPELYLKRLVIGGFESVFEINKCFRNEGVSPKHNPEFTTLEFYQAWATYEDLMEMTEDLFDRLIHDDQLRFQWDGTFNGHKINMATPFRKASMAELVLETTGEEATGLRLVELFEKHVEHTLIDPTFVTGFPVEVSPLARKNEDDPSITDRFELYIGGWEFANGFSELNDPVDQAERFAAQAQAKDSGDEEAMHFDSDYIRALSYGMPPTAGEGIGIDRLVMLLTGRTHIRDVILFPTMRPESVG